MRFVALALALAVTLPLLADERSAREFLSKSVDIDIPPAPKKAGKKKAKSKPPRTSPRTTVYAPKPQEKKARTPAQATTLMGQNVELNTADLGGILEVVNADDYIEFAFIEAIDEEAINWDPNSGRFIYLSANEPPFVFLTGTIKPGWELSADDKWVSLREQRFQVKVYLPLEPRVARLKLFEPDRGFKVYRMVHYWTKIPETLRKQVLQGDPKIWKRLGYSKKIESAAFAQLYQGQRPATFVDLDSIKHANLTFRLIKPPVPEDAYDGWRLTVRDARNRLIGEASKYGKSPPYLEWKEVVPRLSASGTYTYRITLYRDDKIYEGPQNAFDAAEGLSVLPRDYLPSIQFEPREEIGHFSFRNDLGVQYSGFYVGCDVSFVFANRFVVRGVGLMSMHNVDPLQSYTFTRVGGGFRFGGHGDDPILGVPHLYRVDILLSHSGITIYPNAPVRRYTHFSLLVEPHVVLHGYHYVVPWFELGSKVEFEQMRFSAGLTYFYYIRPWSTKLGMGLVWDRLFKFEGAEELKFSIFRANVNFTFFL